MGAPSANDEEDARNTGQAAGGDQASGATEDGTAAKVSALAGFVFKEAFFMKQAHVGMVLVLMLLCAISFAQAQQTVATNNNSAVPQLVNYSGVLTDVNGKPLSGVVGVTFNLYSEETGGVPLWSEIQNVHMGKSGYYAVMLGSTSSTGLPQDVFVSGEARWLGVQAEGQAEQPRILLVAVPYALKAGDAQTIG